MKQNCFSYKIFAFLWLFLLPYLVIAQQLSPDAFLQQVRSNHPVAKQATLLSPQAEATLLSARGGFDPKVYGDWERKSFDGKNYFNIAEGGVKLPTWYGIEGKLGYNYATGINLSPEHKLPADGQAVLGASVTLLQGLVIDERRAGLFQARILQRANIAEQRLLMNDLLYEAAKAYWDWSLADAWVRTYEEAVRNAEIRLDGIRGSWEQGDRPAIDTLEALIQVQDRRLELNAAQLHFRNARLVLQNFNWENGRAVAVDTTLRPQPLADGLLADAITLAPADTLAAQHPQVQGYRFKLEKLDVERRLKREALKPRLDVSYNLLGDGFDLSPNKGDLFLQNYKWGVQAGFPLFFRKERGGLQLAELKILDAELGLTQKRQEIRNKINAYQNELANLRQQIILANAMRDNYARLLAGENEKFVLGESSVFLVNSRENKLIEAQLKLAKLQAEARKTEAALRWAAGQWQ
ncbi:MAG: TolC family protein [Saprospiraceae bacterium]|nr:TolC family protein [Saprospiraceae bacterium]